MGFYDAQANIGFLQNQRSHIENEVNQTKYPEIQYSSLIPVDTSANPFAASVTYYSSEMSGKAEWTNGNAKDIPNADSNMTQHQTQVHTAAIGYSYGVEELGAAQMTRMNLTADKAMAARRAYEEMVDRVALTGDTAKGFKGLINYDGVTTTSASGAFSTLTEDQILAVINGAITGVAVDTKQTAMANTLILPYEQLSYLSSNRLGDTGMTILKFLRTENSYTAMTGQELMIRFVRGLETAGAGDSARLAAYNRNPETLKLHIPMTHRFFPVQQQGFQYNVPGMFRLGGLDIRRPKEVRYVDGI